MNYKRLFHSQERFVGKRQGWRIFLDKEAKYYALNKNDKSPAFTYRSDLNRWLANRDKQLRDQQTSNQAELFWRQPPLVGWQDYAMQKKISGAKVAGCTFALAEPRKRSTITRCELAKRNRVDVWTLKVWGTETRCASVKPLADARSKDDQDRAKDWLKFTNLNRNTRNREGEVVGSRLKNSRKYIAVRFPIHSQNLNASSKCDPTRKSDITAIASSNGVSDWGICKRIYTTIWHDLMLRRKLR